MAVVCTLSSIRSTSKGSQVTLPQDAITARNAFVREKYVSVRKTALMAL